MQNYKKSWVLLNNDRRLPSVLVNSKHLTLSDSTIEAGHKELAKVAKSCKFLQIFLDELKLVDTPCEIFEGNDVAMFLTRNRKVIKCTNNVDLKHHFVREFSKDTNGLKKLLCIRHM